ncbi:SIR2 family NAD-dependent protein deacylase [Anaeromyxobacter paludicola]|uniref:protein acetyllysine N-acetyltransferase n=1 Tax=Anaeromyxobacter paludicola TaxID=2918171 RepID=A0ABM7XBV7_9BACT|nr:Sir2 family NAD-dependent protein deacetylase [Anaeromyxobacter paludicola]BDG09349.1 NAD-dependent protein deacylase [Anaeromyxobacter paludicola]
MEPALQSVLEPVRARRGRVVVLTGAGISAESGIPTFRGAEGYWVVGSRNYMPQEMATLEMFERAPDEVWRWYLYRFGVCKDALPNEGHRALVALERGLGDRFTLVTQNIDGLHRRAGSSEARTCCIHGDAAWVRCAQGCPGLLPLPDMGRRGAADPFTAADRARLACPRCGGWLRPHVLWFDECYDEEHYRMDTALGAAWSADLLLVVGTSGATNLPMQIGQLAFRRQIALVDVNPEPNPFAELAERSGRGFFARGSASERLPEIVRALLPAA